LISSDDHLNPLESHPLVSKVQLLDKAPAAALELNRWEKENGLKKPYLETKRKREKEQIQFPKDVAS